ncbi:MAG TPA: choice-of-anchor Q domain-containing protein, partial [Lysobacter sp.]
PLAGSPVVDKVAVISGVVTDFVMAPRPSGAKADIGAYEVQAGGTTPPTTPPTDPSPTCTRAAPTLSLSGSTAAVAAGSAVNYTVNVRNNDSTACANTSFNVASSVPTGWTGTLSAASVTLAPGASGTASLQVNSPTTATQGSYGIGTGISSNVGGTHTANASSTYSVGAAASALTETVTTSQSSYSIGSTVYMTAKVLNKGVPVQGASVRFNSIKPNGIDTNAKTVTTDANGVATWSFVSGTGASSIGTYNLTADATYGTLTARSTTTFTVGAAAAPALTETVTTSKATYYRGSTVYMTAKVLNKGVPVQGASVRFNSIKPNGIDTNTKTVTTDANGVATWSFVSGTGASSIGKYNLTADATYGTLTARSTTTFTVN